MIEYWMEIINTTVSTTRLTNQIDWWQTNHMPYIRNWIELIEL